MSYIPKYILKRIVPKKGVANIDLIGDGSADHVGIRYVNVVAPMEIPADIDKEDLMDQFVSVNIDEVEITELYNLKLWYENELFNFEDLDKLLGKTVPVGAVLIILLEKENGVAAGEHSFGMTSQYQGQVSHYEVKRSIPEDVKNLDYLKA